MAFPVVETTATTATAAGTSHTVTLPTGIANGDLLIIFGGSNTNTTFGYPAGWTELWDAGGGTAAGSGAFRRADGGEGASVTVTTAASAQCGWVAYRISGHHTTSDPEDAVAATGVGTTPDPPSTPASWGTEDNLWLAGGAHDNTTVNTAPTNYTNLLSASANGTAYSSRRALAATTENPGTFGVGTSDDWITNTIVIRPAAAAGDTQEWFGCKPVLPMRTVTHIGY